MEQNSLMESKVKKSKTTKTIEEPKLLSKEAWVRQATSWLRENSVLSNYEINAMVLSCYMSSKHVRDVEMFINRETHNVDVKIYVGRFTYLFRDRNKILKSAIDGLKPVLGDKHTLNIKICLDKNRG